MKTDFDFAGRALALVVAAGLLLFAGFLGLDRVRAESPQAIPRTAAPEGARLYFLSPADGDTVKSPFVVKFGLAGMGVAPAGIDHPKTGHHHLLVDTKMPTRSEGSNSSSVLNPGRPPV